VLAKQVTMVSGLSVLNLCTLSNHTIVGFLDIALELASRRETRPAHIVLSILPQSLEVTELEARQWGMLGRYLVAYFRRSPHYDVRISDWWAWHIRKHRFNILPPEMGGTYNSLLERVNALQGSLSLQEKSYQHPSPSYIKYEFTATAFAVRPLHDLLKALRGTGVKTSLMLNPKGQGSISQRYMDGVQQFVTKLKTLHPSLSVIVPEVLAHDQRWFSDSNHLHLAGAMEYSRKVGLALKQMVVE
jgi:hypothetical protein